MMMLLKAVGHKKVRQEQLHGLLIQLIQPITELHEQEILTLF